MGSSLTQREFLPQKNSFRVEEVGNENQRECILVRRSLKKSHEIIEQSLKRFDRAEIE